MLRFGKYLGTLDREVPDIKLMNDCDPQLIEDILSGDKERAKRAVEKLFNKNWGDKMSNFIIEPLMYCNGIIVVPSPKIRSSPIEPKDRLTVSYCLNKQKEVI